MVLIGVAALLFVVAFVDRRRSLHTSSLDSFRHFVRVWLARQMPGAHVRLEAENPDAPVPAVTAARTLAALLKTSRKRGLAYAETLTLLLDQLEVAGDFFRRRERLLGVLRARVLAGLGLGAVVRLWFASEGSLPEAVAALVGDELVGVGLFIASGGLLGLQWGLPDCWLWRNGLTGQGRVWLETHLFDRPPVAEGKELPWLRSYADLKRQELRYGVVLRGERQRLLRELARQSHHGDTLSLKAFEDWVPLWELGVVGGPVFLLLVSGFGA